MKKNALGRGLDALLGSDDDKPQSTAKGDALTTLKIDQLQPGKYQPRTRMDEASLTELAESIRSQGIMQPILVRAVAGGRHEIIAGERRWRASKIAGLTEVPVLIRDVPDNAALAMALIENIQREDLNPLEEAAGIQRLLDEFKLTHEQAAQAVGRSRASTSNLLRLLSLSKPVQQLVFEGALDMGHARALIPVEGPRQAEIARQVVSRGLSVRETERLVQQIQNPPARAGKTQRPRDIERFEEELSERFGTTVQIKPGPKGSGRLVINFINVEHLDDLLSRFKG